MAPSAEEANLLSTSDPSNVRAWLAAHHTKQLSMLDRFEIELRLGRLSTSATAAARAQSSLGEVGMFSTSDRRLVTSRTVDLLKVLVGSTRWRNAAQLLTLLRGIGRGLHAAGGFREPAIGNVVRRIMGAVREEALNDDQPSDNNNSKGAEPGAEMESIDELGDTIGKMSLQRGGGGDRGSRTTKISLTNMLWVHPQVIKRSSSGRHRSDSFSSIGSDSHLPSGSAGELPAVFYVNRPDLKQSVMEAIQEIMNDLEDLHKNINDQATSHIHAGEIILCYGRSKTVELFLTAAAKKRKFQVVVCEGAPHFGGHAMAKSLAKAGIYTTVINDSATFAIMARVNKVLLPAHAVLVSTVERCRNNE